MSSERLVFERLWRGTFQTVVSQTTRGRAASMEPNPRPDERPVISPTEALQALFAGLRSTCCCRCNCPATPREPNQHLQVCLDDEERGKSVRSVVRCDAYIQTERHIDRVCDKTDRCFVLIRWLVAHMFYISFSLIWNIFVNQNTRDCMAMQQHSLDPLTMYESNM